MELGWSQQSYVSRSYRMASLNFKIPAFPLSSYSLRIHECLEVGAHTYDYTWSRYAYEIQKGPYLQKRRTTMMRDEM